MRAKPCLIGNVRRDKFNGKLMEGMGRAGSYVSLDERAAGLACGTSIGAENGIVFSAKFSMGSQKGSRTIYSAINDDHLIMRKFGDHCVIWLAKHQ
jgi:hypothetical protein